MNELRLKYVFKRIKTEKYLSEIFIIRSEFLDLFRSSTLR